MDTIQDEINLEPDTSMQGRAPAGRKNRDPLAPKPSITKRLNKKIQLSRRRSIADLSLAGQGQDYGLLESDYAQPEDTALKITSVRGGCSNLHFDEDHSDENGFKEEPAPTVSEARDRLFDEMEKTDPENIASNISSLSLGVNLDEMAVLRQIF